MSESLRTLPASNLILRLQALGVTKSLRDEIDRRLQDGKAAERVLEQHREWIAYLEQHVPEEIARPKVATNYGPKRTGD